jgi:hypothetical protein
MPNSILTMKNAPGVVAKLAAKMFANKLQFAKIVDQADESDFGGKNGFNAGDTIYISKPSRSIPGTNRNITGAIGDFIDEKVPLTLDIQRVDSVALTSNEIATDLAFKSWAKRILEPRVATMAQFVEKDFLERAADATFNSVGSFGTNTFDTETMLLANQRITEMACPDFDNRNVLLSPAAMTKAVNARKGLFNPTQSIGDQAIKGRMGDMDGLTYYQSNLLNNHANGNDVVFEVRTTVSTQGQTTLVVEALTANTGTVTKGTVITIAGVNAVNPVTKEDLGYLQQFTVLSNVTADASGYATLSLSPGFYTTGGLQNITAFPADGAAITPVGTASGTSIQNLAFHKSAFRMASVPLILPTGSVDMAAQETYEGVTIRVVSQYDIFTDQSIMRFDFLGGLCPVRPEWSVRLPS